MPESKPEREPRALTAEYHKARKQLMLWAGILFVWELIGIDLEKAKDVGGSAGAIIAAVKSPQAVPWVLLILVGYFLFKVSVEWYQCSAPRRRLRVSRIDVASAWIVSLAAYALYLYQAVKKVQFADVVQESRLGIMLLIGGGFGAGFKITLNLIDDIETKYYLWKVHGRTTFEWRDLSLFLPPLIASLSLFIYRLIGVHVYWVGAVSGVVIGVAGAVVLRMVKILASYRTLG
jgi:hypothetical protein